MSAVDLFFHKAKWVSGATKVFFRKEVNITESGTLYFRGNNFRHKIWIDGQLKLEGDQLAHCENSCNIMDDIVATTLNAGALSVGKHLVAIQVEDASLDGNGVLIKGYMKSPTNKAGKQVLDTTFKCWDAEEAGWNQAGFDDSHWIYPGYVDAFDKVPANSKFVYPNTMWFRNVFSSNEETDVRLMFQGSSAARRAIASVEHIDFRGRKLALPIGGAANAPRLMVLQKVTYKDGTTRIIRKAHVR
jgi:hypothetical protein